MYSRECGLGMYIGVNVGSKELGPSTGDDLYHLCCWSSEERVGLMV